MFIQRFTILKFTFLKGDIVNISRYQVTAVNPQLMCRWTTPVTPLQDVKTWISSAKPNSDDTNLTLMETVKAFRSDSSSKPNPSGTRRRSLCSLRPRLQPGVVEFCRALLALVLVARRGRALRWAVGCCPFQLLWKTGM